MPQYGKILIVCMALVAWSAGSVMAQERGSWSIDVRAGAAAPMDDLADLAVEDAAVAFGAGAAYHRSSRLSFRFGVDAEFFSSESGDDDPDEPAAESAADVQLIHYTAEARYRVTPTDWRWSASASLGGGVTTWSIDPFTGASGSVDFSETYPTISGGLDLGFDITPDVTVTLDGNAYVAFADETDTAVLASITEPEPEDDDDSGEDTSHAISLPVRLGVSFRF